jgi:CRP/FNR family transcriptional regulator
MLDRAPVCRFAGLRTVGAKPKLCGECSARELAVCGAFEPDLAARLEALLAPVRLAPRRALFAEGDPADSLYTLRSGTLSFAKSLPDGRRQVVGFLSAGAFVGHAFEARYVYTAEAITVCELCRFPRREFEALLQRFPVMEHRLLEAVSNELSQAQDHMLILGRKTARERVATFLLAMLAFPGARGAGPELVVLPMNREDVADYLGLRLETVSRTLGALRDEGVITLLEPQRIRIRARDALERLAAGSPPA